ncbi:MAG: helix-turn-helix transcriptional regulator [Christensenellales bacterium]|jgi:AraC-like DNA-binding protein
MLWKLLSKKSVLHQWIITYIVIALICICICGGAIYLSYSAVISESTRANTLMMNSLRASIDSQLDGIIRMSVAYTQNNKLIALSVASDFRPEDRWQFLLRLIDDINMQLSLNNAISNTVILLNGIDRVFSAKGVANTSIFFFHSLPDLGISYEQWHELISSYHKGNFISMPTESGSNRIFYIRSFPYSEIQPELSNVAVLINDSFFSSIIQSSAWPGGSTCIIGDDNQVLWETGQHYQLTPQLLSGASEQSFTAPIAGERCVVTVLRSQVSPLRYVSVVPLAVYSQKIIRLRNIVLSMMLVCLMIIALLIRKFSAKNYQAVTELMNLFSPAKGKGEHKKSNEFVMIQEELRATLKDFESAKYELRNKSSIMKNDFLSRLIMGSISDQDAKHYFALYAVDFPCAHFSILLLEVESGGGENDRELFLAGNILEEHLSRSFICHSVFMQYSMVYLLNFSQEKQDYILDVKKAYYQSKAVLGKRFSLRFALAASDVKSDWRQLKDAYSEALETLDFNVMSCMDSIVFFRSDEHHIGDYSYSMAREQALTNCLFSGDEQGAMAVVDEVLAENARHINIPAALGKCIMYDLMGTVLKVMSDMDRKSNHSISQQHDRINRIVSSKSFEEFRQELQVIVHQVCRMISSQKKSHTVKLRDDIADYVQSSYADGNLSITAIASHFGMNPAYIARLYKESAGHSLSDLINLTRIAHVKKLLKQNNTLTIIADRTGFSNDITLIRIFKKYEGITPGKYKETYRGESV